MYYLLAFAALSFLIVVHEGGHYFVARWCRMRIERFSIGFGPAVFKRKAKKTGTTFQLAPILFGGFVEIRGMNIAEDVDPDDPSSYPNRPAWQRFLTIFAGPATNYVSAIVLAMAVFAFHGIDEPRWYGVNDVMEGYDAHGKLEKGDRIVAVDHGELLIGKGATLIERVNAAHGAPLTLTIERNGAPRDITITPRLDKDGDSKPIWRIGVKPEPQFEAVDVGLLTAARTALRYPIEQTKADLIGIYGIIFGNERADIGGPKRMIDEFHKAFSLGLVPGLKLLMSLSVWLALFNLLPVPALDGGRLVFLGYEMITRRRANSKIEATVHMAGIMVLFVVMIVVTLIDLHVL
ncbi:MAG TPA: M50 family metallopeptidase [Kofleriaceae bacterium]|nr:M50 family metallopeptidase [Kofleriaceae bacterium]